MRIVKVKLNTFYKNNLKGKNESILKRVKLIYLKV